MGTEKMWEGVWGKQAGSAECLQEMWGSGRGVQETHQATKCREEESSIEDWRELIAEGSVGLVTLSVLRLHFLLVGTFLYLVYTCFVFS
jgi:hypothetical protein